nr:MAG TPA: hypothetical protein [Caudoviricetes sp.]
MHGFLLSVVSDSVQRDHDWMVCPLLSVAMIIIGTAVQQLDQPRHEMLLLLTLTLHVYASSLWC